MGGPDIRYRDATVSVFCNPEQQDCVTVTRGFVAERGRLLESAINLEEELRQCQAALRR